MSPSGEAARPWGRLFKAKRAPLRLAHVPRDHVEGDRKKGEAIRAGMLVHAGERIGLADLDFSTIPPDTPIGAHVHGFSWLRDLAEAASREHGAPLVEAIAQMKAARGLDFHIEVDGGVDPDTAPRCVDAGATALVAGTAVFRGGPDAYASNIAALKGA